MIRFMKYVLLVIVCMHLSGCWWAYTLGVGVGSSLIDGKRKRQDEIKRAVHYARYDEENKHRSTLGLPPVEEDDIPSYERRKNSLFY